MNITDNKLISKKLKLHNKLISISYGVHTSLLELPHRLLIPPTPLKKVGKNFSKFSLKRRI